MGMYMVLGILFLFLVRREIENGPVAQVDRRLTRGFRCQQSGSSLLRS